MDHEVKLKALTKNESVCMITSMQAVLTRETSGSRLDGLIGGEMMSAAFSSNYRETTKDIRMIQTTNSINATKRAAA